MRRLAPLLGWLLAGCAIAQSMGGSIGGLARVAQSAGFDPKLTVDPQAIVEGLKERNRQYTAENEYFIGRAVAAQVLRRYGNQVLRADDPVSRYVTSVGAVVAAAAAEVKDLDVDRPDPWKGYRFVVLAVEEKNAFAAPGGIVFVTLGAVKATRTEEELAGLLAHEIAHVAKGHGLLVVRNARMMESFKRGVQLDAGELQQFTKVFTEALDDIVDSLLVKGYDREYELQADRVGTLYASRAAYASGGMRDFLLRLAAEEKNDAYKTHPPPSVRIDALEKVLQQLGPNPAVRPQAREPRFARAMGTRRAG